MPLKVGSTNMINVYTSNAKWQLDNAATGLDGGDYGRDPLEEITCPFSMVGIGYVTYGGNKYKCVGTRDEVYEVKVGSTTMHKRPLITFNLNYSGGGTYSTQRRTTGVETVTNPGNPTRSGYTFNGWFTATSGGSQLTFPYTTPSADTTYYAQWTESTPQTVMPTLFTQYIGTSLVSVQVRARNVDNSGSATILMDVGTNPPTTNRGSIAYNAYTSWVTVTQQGVGVTVYATAQVSGELKSAVRSVYAE